MPILLAGTIEIVHIEQVSALFTFRLGQVLLYILTNGLSNTLKLATFSLCVIHVHGLINILKYEIFFLNRKLLEIFWLHFYIRIP
jgi:hypothetical protein